MARYSIIAKVDQIVTKEIRLQISAKNEKEAEAFARDASWYPISRFISDYSDKEMGYADVAKGIQPLINKEDHSVY